MDFNVSHILKGPIGTTRDYDLEPADIQLDDNVVAHINGGHVRFDRTNTGIIARGQVEATAILACARCLDEANVDVVSAFTETFEPSVDVMTGRPLGAPEDELAFQIDERHILDLREPLRQNLLALLPIQTLCRPDCAGLCTVCGTNKNVASCSCVMVAENHPLAGLADLLEGTS